MNALHAPRILPPALALALALIAAGALPASAECFADYKARKDNPLQLHYGVVELRGPCTTAAAKAELRERLDAGGWRLLNVMGVFDRSGLASRRDAAGAFFLRY